MAYGAKKVEHSGPKKGRGAYYGRKATAKHESSKVRRRQARKEISAETQVAGAECAKPLWSRRRQCGAVIL